jgi:glutathione peroxidase-family protein
MNIHGLKFLYRTFQDRSYFIIHMPGTNFHKKKRPLNAAFSYLGLRA